VILDLVGATDRMDLTTLPLLFGLSEGTPEERAAVEQGVLEATGMMEERQVREGALLQREVALFNRRDLAWARTADGERVLQVGDEHVMIEPDGTDTFAVAIYTQRGRRVLADRLEVGYAIGTAEDYARSSDGFAAALVSRGAAWRQRPASRGQLDALRRMRVMIPDALSSGDASDLMTAAIATRRARRARGAR
jgi:hypothetical protein